MKNKIYLCLIIFILNAQASKPGIAFEKVMKNIKGSVPESFVRNAFKHKKVEIYNEIPDKFARPYEKQTWEKYRKIFVKESRISRGAKFYKENINRCSEALIWNYSSVKKFLSYFNLKKDIDGPIDTKLDVFSSTGNFNIYWCNPEIVYQGSILNVYDSHLR